MKQIKPIPYYTQVDDEWSKRCAKELRDTFKPLVEKKLHMHHMVGLRHDAIVNFVAHYKNTHPYYVRTDIQKYYPSVRAHTLVAQAQFAYRALIGHTHVPMSFKKRFMKPMVHWMQSLPFEQGIPMGSAMSLIMAQVGLIPIWLEVKRCHQVELIIVADDVLIMCREKRHAEIAWKTLKQRLEQDMKLHLNNEKTKSGRLGTDTVEFCGWHFAGGYVTICEEKYKEFKERVKKKCYVSRKKPTRAFIKDMNHLVDGFGNHYKYGAVLRQFEELDKWIRTNVRSWLCGNIRHTAWTNKALEDIGLHSLENIYRKAHNKKDAKKNPRPAPEEEYYKRKNNAPDWGVLATLADTDGKILEILKKIEAEIKKNNKFMKRLLDPMLTPDMN